MGKRVSRVKRMKGISKESPAMEGSKLGCREEEAASRGGAAISSGNGGRFAWEARCEIELVVLGGDTI